MYLTCYVWLLLYIARIFSSGCMSAPVDGTIAHITNRHTYRTKTTVAAYRVWHYTDCRKGVSILGLHSPFLYFFGHTLHAETSAALTTFPHPYLPHPHVCPLPSSSPSSFSSNTDFRTVGHSLLYKFDINIATLRAD